MRRALIFLLPVLLAVVATVGSSAVAQELPTADDPTAYVSRSWLSDDGLPHNVVSRIEQDRDGYLWVATMAGLARFDGREFRNFPIPGDTGHRRNIRDFALLPDGRVLFLPATGGVLQVKDNDVSFHPLSQVALQDPLLQLYAEPSGAIWLEAGQGLLRWDGDRLERFGEADGINRRRQHFSWATDDRGRTWIGGASFLGYYQPGKLVRVAASDAVYRVGAARDGGIWVYSNGLYKWAGEKLSAIAGPGWPTARASIRCLYEDRAGTLWLATSRAGLFRFGPDGYAAVPDVEPGIEYVTEDREGDIWVATDGGGIRRLRPKSATFLATPVTSVAADTDGTMWFAATAAGVLRRTAEGQQVFPVQIGHIPIHVMTVCVDHQHRVWLATTSGIFRLAPDNPARSVRIDPAEKEARVLYCDHGGTVWAAGENWLGCFRDDVFHRIGTLAAGERVSAIAEPPGGPMAVGTSRGGLYSVRGDALVPVNLPPGAHLGAVHALLAPGPDVLWIGTAEGLVHYDGRALRRLTVAEGLPDDPVLQVLAAESDLWLATPRGLFRLPREELKSWLAGDRQRLTPVAYGPEEGLSGISPITNETPAACADPRGNLWFCTYNGAVAIDTSRVPHGTVPPPVLIEETRLDDQVAVPGGHWRIPAGEHRLEFRFAALSFAAPERVRLRHQLEGFDVGWIDTAPDRVARYAKLAPGEYRLRVIGSNGEGVWNRAGAELAITVLPAWWQTWWFTALYVVAFAGLIGGSARYWSQRKLKARLLRLEHEHALEKERARIARDMHDELGGSVTGINLAVQRLRDAPAPEVNRLIDLLDRRVRGLTVELERVVWTVSPKHGSLEQLATFIERFAHNLLTSSPVRCRVLGRDGIPARPISPDVQHHVLAITKEAIHNVVKHSGATEVVIEMRCEGDAFALSICDNGVGFDPDAHEFSDRNGLRNMRARIAEIDGALVIRRATGGGTAVLLQVPVAGPAARPS